MRDPQLSRAFPRVGRPFLVAPPGVEPRSAAESAAIRIDSRQDARTRVDVSAREPVGVGPSETAPSSSDDALKLAIKLAVEAGDYDRAATLIGVAKQLMKR